MALWFSVLTIVLFTVAVGATDNHKSTSITSSSNVQASSKLQADLHTKHSSDKQPDTKPQLSSSLQAKPPMKPSTIVCNEANQAQSHNDCIKSAVTGQMHIFSPPGELQRGFIPIISNTFDEKNENVISSLTSKTTSSNPVLNRSVESTTNMPSPNPVLVHPADGKTSKASPDPKLAHPVEINTSKTTAHDPIMFHPIEIKTEIYYLTKKSDLNNKPIIEVLSTVTQKMPSPIIQEVPSPLSQQVPSPAIQSSDVPEVNFSEGEKLKLPESFNQESVLTATSQLSQKSGSDQQPVLRGTVSSSQSLGNGPDSESRTVINAGNSISLNSFVSGPTGGLSFTRNPGSEFDGTANIGGGSMVSKVNDLNKVIVEGRSISGGGSMLSGVTSGNNQIVEVISTQEDGTVLKGTGDSAGGGRSHVANGLRGFGNSKEISVSGGGFISSGRGESSVGNIPSLNILPSFGGGSVGGMGNTGGGADIGSNFVTVPSIVGSSVSGHRFGGGSNAGSSSSGGVGVTGLGEKISDGAVLDALSGFGGFLGEDGESLLNGPIYTHVTSGILPGVGGEPDQEVEYTYTFIGEPHFGDQAALEGGLFGGGDAASIASFPGTGIENNLGNAPKFDVSNFGGGSAGLSSSVVNIPNTLGNSNPASGFNSGFGGDSSFRGFPGGAVSHNGNENAFMGGSISGGSRTNAWPNFAGNIGGVGQNFNDQAVQKHSFGGGNQVNTGSQLVGPQNVNSLLGAKPGFGGISNNGGETQFRGEHMFGGNIGNSGFHTQSDSSGSGLNLRSGRSYKSGTGVEGFYIGEETNVGSLANLGGGLHHAGQSFGGVSSGVEFNSFSGSRPGVYNLDKNEHRAAMRQQGHSNYVVGNGGSIYVGNSNTDGFNF